jgi:hypothetical protein
MAQAGITTARLPCPLPCARCLPRLPPLLVKGALLWEAFLANFLNRTSGSRALSRTPRASENCLIRLLRRARVANRSGFFIPHSLSDTDEAMLGFSDRASEDALRMEQSVALEEGRGISTEPAPKRCGYIPLPDRVYKMGVSTRLQPSRLQFGRCL